MPTLFWTLFYTAVKLFDGGITPKELLTSLFSIPFSAQNEGVLWFMYTLAGLYLITPILHGWLRTASEKEIRFYLSLWAVTMCYPVLRLVLDINDSSTGVLYYVSGYAGYFVLGYWMQLYGHKLKFPLVVLLMLVSISVPVLIKLKDWEIDYSSMFGNLSIFMAVQCVFWWKLLNKLHNVLNLSDKAKHLVIVFSNLSFGIYLSHIFIMKHCVWKIPFVINIHQQLLQIFVVAALTLMLSVSLSYMLSLTPLGNAVVGWRVKGGKVKHSSHS